MKFFKVILIGVLFLACKEESQLGSQELLIGYEQTVTQEILGRDWTVSFTSIDENSLCPEDVTCVWLGRLVVGLRINGTDAQIGIGDLQNNTEVELTDVIMIDGVTITLSEAYDTEEASTTQIKLRFED